ncbi:MAG TPA: SUMF1/EgtB/PvdO family nonheme iron enzyme, partial [Terriglobales bacterium]|nr:SUMF1/EgtB/PvdO family nonheme iron enzyme [Terriglobales bacterium]
MKEKELQMFRKWDWGINALLVLAALLIMARIAWGLDTQDITVEWTEKGKRIAEQRVATIQSKDEMVPVPAGEFLMGSDKKVDRNAYKAELPQRRVYLDAYEINKYEVTNLQ